MPTKNTKGPFNECVVNHDFCDQLQSLTITLLL